MNNKQTILLTALSVLLGGFLIFSAYSKTQPSVQSFEFTISSQLGVPSYLSAVAARIFIGLEAAIGLLLLATIYGRRKWVLKGYILLMLLFSVHLVILLFRLGNDVDCGCMGSLLPMSPGVSLLKNAGLILGGIVLHRFYKQTDKSSLDILALATVVLFLIGPFLLYPPLTNRNLPLEELQADMAPGASVDFRTGKHIVSLMSLSCGHCRDAAKKFHEVYEKNPRIPLYFIFPKSSSDSLQAVMFEDFMKDTHDNDIPYQFVSSETFVKMLNAVEEKGVPTIIWLSDGKVVRKTNGGQIDQAEIEAWLNQKTF